MTKKQLIEMLADVPDDGLVCIMQSDELMGYYCYTSPYLSEDIALKDKKGTLWANISNYTGDEPVKIWVLQ